MIFALRAPLPRTDRQLSLRADGELLVLICTIPHIMVILPAFFRFVKAENACGSGKNRLYYRRKIRESDKFRRPRHDPRYRAEAFIQRMEAERRAREESERNLMKKYGYSVNRLRSQVEVVTLTADELDDDTLIVMLEDSPTYNRDIRKINQLRRGGGFDAPETNTSFTSANTNTTYKKPDNNSNSVISFR